MQTVNGRQFLRETGAATLAAGGLAIPLAAAPPAASDGGGTTCEGSVGVRGGQVFNVTNPAYGAKGDTMNPGRRPPEDADER